jgi:serine/threonine protein kinase
MTNYQALVILNIVTKIIELELLRKMLIREPSVRITAKDALEHEYFNSIAISRELKNIEPKDKDTLDKK